MVLVKHSYLKSDIFLNPIFIPGFPGSRFLGSGSRGRVQGLGPGSWSRVQGPDPGPELGVQFIEVAIKNN